MKKAILTAMVISLLAAATATAQMMGEEDRQSAMMADREKTSDRLDLKTMQDMMQQYIQSGMMMDQGQKMMYGNNNMMGNYGMMPMTRGSYGKMPMMNGGYGMMPMMGGSYGMMPMMGGYGMMHNQGQGDLKKYGNFVKETREMRKKLHDLMFDYGEAQWNPDTTLGDLSKMTEEINQLRDAIQKKMSP